MWFFFNFIKLFPWDSKNDKDHYKKLSPLLVISWVLLVDSFKVICDCWRIHLTAKKRRENFLEIFSMYEFLWIPFMWLLFQYGNECTVNDPLSTYSHCKQCFLVFCCCGCFSSPELKDQVSYSGPSVCHTLSVCKLFSFLTSSLKESLDQF